MEKLGRDSFFVRIRLDIPRQTYEHLMELYDQARAKGITESPDVVAASCIDSVHELIFKKDGENESKKE